MVFLSGASWQSWLPSVECVSLRQSSRFLRAGGADVFSFAFAIIDISAVILIDYRF